MNEISMFLFLETIYFRLRFLCETDLRSLLITIVSSTFFIRGFKGTDVNYGYSPFNLKNSLIEKYKIFFVRKI